MSSLSLVNCAGFVTVDLLHIASTIATAQQLTIRNFVSLHGSILGASLCHQRLSSWRCAGAAGVGAELQMCCALTTTPMFCALLCPVQCCCLLPLQVACGMDGYRIHIPLGPRSGFSTLTHVYTCFPRCAYIFYCLNRPFSITFA